MRNHTNNKILPVSLNEVLYSNRDEWKRSTNPQSTIHVCEENNDFFVTDLLTKKYFELNQLWQNFDLRSAKTFFRTIQYTNKFSTEIVELMSKAKNEHRQALEKIEVGKLLLVIQDLKNSVLQSIELYESKGPSFIVPDYANIISNIIKRQEDVVSVNANILDNLVLLLHPKKKSAGVVKREKYLEQIYTEIYGWRGYKKDKFEFVYKRSKELKEYFDDIQRHLDNETVNAKTTYKKRGTKVKIIPEALSKIWKDPEHYKDILKKLHDCGIVSVDKGGRLHWNVKRGHIELLKGFVYTSGEKGWLSSDYYSASTLLAILQATFPNLVLSVRYFSPDSIIKMRKKTVYITPFTEWV